MLQYDGFYYARHEAIDGGEVKKKFPESAIRIPLHGAIDEKKRIFYVSGKLPTYPSPKPTLTLSSYLTQNVGLGEG